MEKLDLSGVKATLLITLYAKAQESRLADSLLRDHYAADAVARIDHDFSTLHLRDDEMIGLAMRAHALDGWTREFIDAHREATVLHLGCGLDTRLFRVDPPPEVAWFEVDYPEVIALRRKLYPDRADCRLIASSVTDLAWLAQVPAGRPTLVVAEGLFLYLPEASLLALLRTVTTQFPTGEVIFDAYSDLGLALVARNRMIRATGATTRWSLNHSQDLEAQVPGLKLRTEQMVQEGRSPAQVARYTLLSRVLIGWMRRLAPLRRVGRLLRYRF
ncbi:class I SAM-dependent methyltransferase [Achromobacter sp. DH1f]|uniref:class I SAM-dependent methyltransferase n=1 Tax=Achromobacter sp. DH1f TaxID=1397275 RepID=UPI000468D9E2|nr:class I SAM-dependent methyltransferase [Achromobacter sp. DH1f]